MSAAPPARSQLLLYGALALPLSFAGLPLYLHAPDFYATALMQPIAVLGGVLLALRILDAVQDPLIGVLSDRFSAHRLMIVIGGAALLLTGFAALFNPSVSPLPDGYTLAWFALSVFLCSTGFSIVTINYQALGGLWNVPSGDRTRVTAVREAFELAPAALPVRAPMAPAVVLGQQGQRSLPSALLEPGGDHRLAGLVQGPARVAQTDAGRANGVPVGRVQPRDGRSDALPQCGEVPLPGVECGGVHGPMVASTSP